MVHYEYAVSRIRLPGAHAFTVLLALWFAGCPCWAADDPDVDKAQGDASRAISSDVDFTVEITQCPQCFVPGHANVVKYRILPGGCTPPYAKFEIFKSDDQGNPTGDAVYSADLAKKIGGREWQVTYSGTEISYEEQDYILKISVGQDADSCSDAAQEFEVLGFDLYYFFWDVLDNGYASGMDIGTVTNNKISLKCWYYDQEEQQAGSASMLDITMVENMPEELATDLGVDKPWYTERGGVYTFLSSVFYAMSEEDQHFYLKVTVDGGGAMDNAANPYDADSSTEAEENVVQYKMKISPAGELTILETTYEQTGQ